MWAHVNKNIFGEALVANDKQFINIQITLHHLPRFTEFANAHTIQPETTVSDVLASIRTNLGDLRLGTLRMLAKVSFDLKTSSLCSFGELGRRILKQRGDLNRAVSG